MSGQGPGPGLVLPWEAVAGLGGLDPPGPGATVGGAWPAGVWVGKALSPLSQSPALPGGSAQLSIG